MNAPLTTPLTGTAVTRQSGLDALRAALTALVLFHHSAITYGASGGWYYHEVLPNRALDSQLLGFFCAVNQSYFMGLFFLLAGYFTPGPVARKGAWRYLRERALRLGVPLLFYLVVLSPLTIALAATAKGRSFLPTLLYLYRHGVFENGPLWFAQALLIFALVFLASRAIAPGWFAANRPPPAFPSNRTLLLAALGVGAAAFALRLVWPIGTQPLGLQLGYFASYVVLFAAGCAAAAWPSLDAAPERQRRRWRIVTRVTLAANFPPLAGDLLGGWNFPALVYAFWEPFLAWGIIFALLHAFERGVPRLGRFESALARRAYTVYIIHPPILVGLALAWREVPAPPVVKFAITGAATCVACFWIAGPLLRLHWVGRIL
jgi:hypothetical protein